MSQEEQKYHLKEEVFLEVLATECLHWIFSFEMTVVIEMDPMKPETLLFR
jgi:hypothetical protein